VRVVLFFIDGLGLAPAGEYNPLSTTDTPCLNNLLGGRGLTIDAVGSSGTLAALQALDATLGVPGCPQSATGQTTLFTGVNAPQALGRHLRGFPNEPLRNILKAEGILKKIAGLGKKPTFLNGFRPEFFTLLSEGKICFSASTMLNLYADLPFYTFEDMAAGRSVYSDITNEVLHELGHQVPLVTPETAGETLARAVDNYDFVLFEYFLTDMIGHKRDREKAAKCIDTIDRFLGSVISSLNFSDTLFMITSDHGNLEDLTSGTHTANPVPLLLLGPDAHAVPQLTDLTDILPFIIDILEKTS
jgi:hypothetical protein